MTIKNYNPNLLFSISFVIIMYDPIHLHGKKVDISFFNAYDQLNKNAIFLRLFYGLRLLAAAIYLIVHLLDQGSKDVAYN